MNEENNNLSNGINNSGNTVKVVLITLLVVVVIGLIGFIVYDKVIKKDNVGNNQTNTGENSNQSNSGINNENQENNNNGENNNNFTESKNKYSLVSVSSEEQNEIDRYSEPFGSEVLSDGKSITAGTGWEYGIENANTVIFYSDGIETKIKLDENVKYWVPIFSFDDEKNYDSAYFLTESGKLYVCDDSCLKTGKDMSDLEYILTNTKIEGLGSFALDSTGNDTLCVKTSDDGIKKLVINE